MYSQAVIAAREAVFLQSPDVRARLAGGHLQRLPVTTCHTYRAQLEGVLDEEGERTRPLTREERAFILNETLLAKIDFAYAAERYIWINYEGQALRPMYPLWESQRLILAAIGAEESRRWILHHPDGLLFNILKGRQLGCSTLVQSLLAHRVLTHSHVRVLIASDVPQNSGSEGLFGMLELVVAHWPWWLKPKELYHIKNHHIIFVNDSRVIVESGKSMKGGLQDEGSTKGQLGRSKTYSGAHLSEIPTWERPEQINSSLLPAIPITPRTLCCREATAQGRNNYWHTEWKLADGGEDPRFFNIFIPWYAEASKYWLPCPGDWIPSTETLAFARRATEFGPRYMARAVRLTREQLYWYEQHYRAAQRRERLWEFLSEYPSEPEEAFQHSGHSIFSLETQTRVAKQARPLADLWTIAPRADLIADKEASQREWALTQAQLKLDQEKVRSQRAARTVTTTTPETLTEETPQLEEVER